MIHRAVKCIALTILPASFLLADFSYEQTSKITGGAMAGMMKVAGVFSKAAREPMRSTVAVKGDRMVTISGKSASVIDLSKETMTEINFDKKQYSVMTFAEFTAMMEEFARKMKSKDGGEMKFSVSVNDTGQSRNINGLDTKQMIMKMVMESQDQKSGQKGGMVITTDMWLAPKVPGYDEVTQFQTRMAQKLSWTPGGGFAAAMGGPEASKALSEIAKEGSKLNGIPVVQYIKMGADGQPGVEAGGEAQQAPPPPQQPEAQAEKPSVGSVLGGRLGGFGGFGRRRKQQKEEPPAQQAPSQASGSGQASSGAAGSLLEMTTEFAGFSSAAVDSSKFEVPAGFKQVKPQKRMR